MNKNRNVTRLSKLSDSLHIDIQNQSSLTFLIVCVWLIFASSDLLADSVLEIGQNERLLVLAPHPDDEALGAGGLIQQVLKRGGKVRVVVATAGDAYVTAIKHDTGKQRLTRTDFLKYGEERLDESRHAANLLGKGRIRLDLLGFSDGSIYSMLVSHWRRTHPDKSGFTGFSHVPYFEAEDQGIAQDGEDLRNELLSILKESKPTLIAFPDVMENDSDHAGLGMFALLAINDWLAHESKRAPLLLAYLIHWQNGWPPGSDADKPLDLKDQPLFLPDDLPRRGHQSVCLNLSAQETSLKKEVLALYHTQQRAMAPFLAAFVHNNECFTLMKDTDGKDIQGVIKQWQYARKAFDSHPISRLPIIDEKTN